MSCYPKSLYKAYFDRSHACIVWEGHITPCTAKTSDSQSLHRTWVRSGISLHVAHFHAASAASFLLKMLLEHLPTFSGSLKELLQVSVSRSNSSGLLRYSASSCTCYTLLSAEIPILEKCLRHAGTVFEGILKQNVVSSILQWTKSFYYCVWAFNHILNEN